MKKTIATIGILAAGLALVGGAVWAASPGAVEGHGPAQMRGHMQAQGMGPGMMGQGMGQGMGPMMLHGGDASATEVGDIHAMFLNNEKIRRSVTNLADGIRTLTESDDPEIADTIKRHVADMTQRLAEKRDPGLPIESPALRAIFENYDKIATNIDVTEKGIAITQTSNDAATVALLQKHASEVTAFVKDGMAGAHTAMMRNMHGRDGAASGMHGTMPAHMMQRMHRMNGAGADDHSAH